jgi:processive 1,2-diacylglycerol beta-glucosyltransferase
MKKILVFPLLDSLPSGHHQVANAVIHYVTSRTTTIECKKIDLLNRWNPYIESMITKTYLSWIQHFPKSYALVYKTLAYQSKKNRTYKHYDLLFKNKMAKIIAEEKPDLIICTHAFPSYLLNNLKKSGACDVPVLNIYTDYFMNDVWGKDRIDYHFVSDMRMKGDLMNLHRIPESKIVVTGIPVDERLTRKSSVQKHNKQLTILVSGGSAGLGSLKKLVLNSKNDDRIRFLVMCGNNKLLYQEISDLHATNIDPLPYISSREEMDQLYQTADAIITKPGGVTISEAVKKRLPIFIHSALPGQEEINLRHLVDLGIVFKLNDTRKNIAEQVISKLNNKTRMMEIQCSTERFVFNQELSSPEKIYQFIESILVNSKQNSGRAPTYQILKSLQI